LDIFRTHFERRHPFTLQYRLKRFDGEYRWMKLQAAPYTQDHGAFAGYLGTCHEIHEEVQSREAIPAYDSLFHERQLLQAQKLESLGVLGNADLALIDLPDDSPVREQIEDIVHAARRATELCHYMLDYSGKGHFKIGVVEITDVLREMSPLLGTTMPQGARIDFDFSRNAEPFRADERQIHQILMSLVTNAAEALKNGEGSVVVSTGTTHCDRALLSRGVLPETLPDGRYTYIKVSDTGEGMTPETMERIFDPFFSTKFTGRGLGLAAVLGIVRGHKGAILVDSRPGEGSTFTVYFPTFRARAESAADASPANGGEAEPERPRILVVDDEAITRRVATAMLEKMGYQVTQAEDGRQAVDAIDATDAPYTVVLLDLTMPVMDGVQTYSEIRQRDPDLPVLLTSGFNKPDIDDKIKDDSWVDFIQKPYQSRDLQSRLVGLLPGPNKNY
jgi:two-component system cell cycle sensor histidine kinase/response regulator CckA